MKIKKIVRPSVCGVYGGTASAFAEIKLEDGKLSICGVVGPTRNGNCKGSCGQCYEEIGSGTPTEQWTAEMLAKFCEIWKEWHLNNMRPYCEHQKKLGWNMMATKKATLYHYRLKMDILDAQKAAQKEAVAALKKGVTFTPTEEQTRLANFPYSTTLSKKAEGEMAEMYEPKKPLYRGDGGFEEVKALGWLTEGEHPEGILSKECPVCGYKYGHSWKFEEIPADVIEFLESLPDADIEPAWV